MLTSVGEHEQNRIVRHYFPEGNPAQLMEMARLSQATGMPMPAYAQQVGRMYHLWYGASAYVSKVSAALLHPRTWLAIIGIAAGVVLLSAVVAKRKSRYEAVPESDYDDAVKGEGWAINDYADMITKADTDKERKVLTHIHDEEQDHFEELKELVEDRFGSPDQFVKGSMWVAGNRITSVKEGSMWVLINPGKPTEMLPDGKKKTNNHLLLRLGKDGQMLTIDRAGRNLIGIKYEDLERLFTYAGMHSDPSFKKAEGLPSEDITTGWASPDNKPFQPNDRVEVFVVDEAKSKEGEPIEGDWVAGKVMNVEPYQDNFKTHYNYEVHTDLGDKEWFDDFLTRKISALPSEDVAEGWMSPDSSLTTDLISPARDMIRAKSAKDGAAIKRADDRIYGVLHKHGFKFNRGIIPYGFTDEEKADPRLLAKRLSCIAKARRDGNADKPWAVCRDAVYGAPDLKKNLTCANPPLDSNGNHLTDPESIAQLESCLSTLPQTKDLHFNKAINDYSPERKELHKQIISKVKEQSACVEQRAEPVAILTGGVPGSGKSTFLRKYAPWLESDKVFRIDADAIRAMLPEYKGWNAAQTHEEARDIVNDLLDSIGQPCKFDIIYDGTMNKAKKYNGLIDKLKSQGYKVYIIFLDVPPEVSKARVLSRYRDGPDHRYVPSIVVNEANAAGMGAFDELKAMVSGWIAVDGVGMQIKGEGGEPIPRERFHMTNGGDAPVMSEESYLATHGASRQDIGESALHKNRGGASDKVWNKIVDAQAAKDRALIAKRDELRAEYWAKVEAGEIRPPSRHEKLIASARGNEDLESTQAARRLLTKKGIAYSSPIDTSLAEAIAQNKSPDEIRILKMRMAEQTLTF